MKKGDKVRHVKQREFVGTITGDGFDAIVCGKPVKLFPVKWDGANKLAFVPFYPKDEGSHGKGGYEAKDLERVSHGRS